MQSLFVSEWIFSVTVQAHKNQSRIRLGEMASIFQKKTRLPADADLMQARGKKKYVQENKTQAAEQEWKPQYVRAGAVQTR